MTLEVQQVRSNPGISSTLDTFKKVAGMTYT
jgi:hypothetical protein